MKPAPDLAARLTRLEDIEAIRTRYEQDRARYIMLTETRPGGGSSR